MGHLWFSICCPVFEQKAHQVCGRLNEPEKKPKIGHIAHAKYAMWDGKVTAVTRIFRTRRAGRGFLSISERSAAHEIGVDQ
jgi:hypothetical protein